MTTVGVNLLWMVSGEVGGSEAYLTRLLLGLAARPPAFDYRLFVLPRFGEFHPTLADAFDVETAPVTGARRPARVAAEVTWLTVRARRAGVDVMHHAGGTVPAGPRRPTLLTIHDLQYLTFPAFFSTAKRRYLEVVVPRSVARADAIMAPSEFTKETIVDRLGVAPERVIVVPIPTQAVLPEAAPAAAVRSRYGLGDRPVFLYPAITYPHKNHVVLVDAMTRVVERHPEAVLVLSGGRGAAESALEQEIFRRSLTGHIRRVGRIPDADLETLFAEATALVFPSRYEGFGAPVVEAMQRGCPVIAADATAVPEVAGGAALLVDADDPRSWADAMCALLEDGAIGRNLVERGLRRVEHFAPDRAAACLEGAYRQVLA